MLTHHTPIIVFAHVYNQVVGVRPSNFDSNVLIITIISYFIACVSPIIQKLFLTFQNLSFEVTSCAHVFLSAAL